MTLLLALACTGPSNDTPAADTGDGPSGLALFGSGTNTVTLEVVADASDGLSQPRDVEVHPTRQDELWVISFGNRSMVVVADVDGARSVDTFKGDKHFFAEPSALAFNDDGEFASAHEEDEKTQGAGGTPEDFMGPTLWDSDRFDAGHPTHLDMLHNSPNAVGVASEGDNRAFWIYDGYHASLTRYDFADDHGYGGADHSDGEIVRWAADEVGYREGVSSHVVYADGFVYAADTANNRVVRLDTSTGEKGRNLNTNYDGVSQFGWDDATLDTLVEGSEFGIGAPSGLAIHDGVLFVGDHATGNLFAFTLDGELIDWAETGLVGMQGLDFDDAGRLYVTAAGSDEVVRIAE